MDFLGGLLSGASNLINGFLNRNAVNKQNELNAWMVGQNALYGPTIQADAATAAEKATGINRLTMLGVRPMDLPAQSVGSLGDSVGQAGQDIGRAITAGNPALKRQQELESQLLEAKIANVNADTVRQHAEASNLVRKFASPGTPPMVNVPLPTPSPFTRDTLPLFQDYRDDRGGRIKMLSHDASQSVMNAASMPLAVPIGAGLIGGNIDNFLDATRVSPINIGRPDVFRNVDPSVMQSMY